MGRIVVQEFITLDGVVQGGGGPDEDRDGGFQHDLVDEYRLMRFPIVLGTGKRLFPDGFPRQDLVVAEDRLLGSGVQVTTYRPRR